MKVNNLLIEAGVTRVEDAVSAQLSGAQRLELNSALILGGLTPSWGLIGETIRAVTIPLMVMIRPRGGGFCYSPSELDVMRRDIVAAATAGARGVVFGPITPSGEIDRVAVERFVRAAGNMECVFHRAFDFCTIPEAALEELINLGVTRVMTSGGGATALAGAARIAAYISQAQGRIEILPAGGIRSGNVRELAMATQCNQVHASFRKSARDETPWPADAPVLGAAPGSEAEHESLDAEEIRRAMDAMAG
jgi:copper homeostasis protein CutC